MSVAGLGPEVLGAASRPMRNSDLPFRAIFEAAAIGINICSLDGHILQSNSAVTRMLGYTREELAGMDPAKLHPDDLQSDDQDWDELLISELIRGIRGSFELDRRFRRKDGTVFWGHVYVSTVRDADHQPVYLIAMLEDTTARRRVEEQLREAEKMEVIGRLAGGVAHDFNNLLTGILLYCDLICAGLQPGDPLRHYADEVRMAGEHGAALTQQLLAIARKQVPQPQPVLLNDIVGATENLIRRLAGEHIEFVTSLSPDLRPVLADPAQLRQVLLNLVLNARDAMPQGGRITVSTASGTVHGAQSAAVLTVQDAGCGMDASTRARLFEPFFTTKQPGNGTGLGLATVRRIVDDSHGAIEVRSELGRGTCIDVFFPVIAEPALVSAPCAATRSGQTILLVDDHRGARRTLHGLLLNSGYRVLEASSCQDALELFSAHASGTDLLITNCTMPGMEGLELARKMRQLKPGLKVLLISSRQDRPAPSPPLPVPVIHKPFSGTEIIQRIRDVLDSQGESPC